MKLFKAMVRRTNMAVGRMLRETGLALDAQGSRLTRDVAYLEPLSRHRNIMPLYDLSPVIGLNTFVAPNATVVGEVYIGNESQIWYGAVLRGDINAIRIGNNTSVGDNTVIHTAGSLPTGIPASVNIGNFVNIQNNCTLYSCTIDDDCFIGFKSIVLEGARLERGCAIAPNSVVPPGRLIPTHQLWAGNPVEYVRDLSKADLQTMNFITKISTDIANDHRYEFMIPSSAYLQKENAIGDTNVSARQERDLHGRHEDGEDARARH